MLVLSRLKGQSIVIPMDGHEIKIVVVENDGRKVRLGIEAPQDVAVHREEVWNSIKHNGVNTLELAPLQDNVEMRRRLNKLDCIATYASSFRWTWTQAERKRTSIWRVWWRHSTDRRHGGYVDILYFEPLQLCDPLGDRTPINAEHNRLQDELWLVFKSGGEERESILSVACQEFDGGLSPSASDGRS